MGGIDRIAQGMGYLSKTRPLKALGNAWNKSPEDVLAWATVASIVLKDGIGCAMYGSCGSIRIANTVTQVTAIKGEGCNDSIGHGYGGKCGIISIQPGANVIQN